LFNFLGRPDLVSCGWTRVQIFHVEERIMKRIGFTLVGIVALAGAVGYMSLVRARADGASAPILGTLPAGYRDWRLISVAHEEGKQNDIRAILGNDIAIKAYREGKLPFPDGAIIARLAWQYVSSEENNRAFGQPQSFIAGAPTNVQFMVKDSTKYASTGGWGFAQFNDGKPIDAAGLTGCFACHVPVKARDFVFNRYSP
jgi:Cytochrome P460